MRILFLSIDGDGLSVAHQLVREGNQVDLWTKNSLFSRNLHGIVNRIDGWKPYLRSADLIVADMVGLSAFRPIAEQANVPILGLNSGADKLELDRQFAIQTMQDVGILVPETHYFPDMESAKALRWTSTVGYVLKPCGNVSPGKTRLCRDRATYDWALQGIDGPVIVQELVQGIEVSTEGWFNGTSFLRPFNHTFEEKRLMPGTTSRLTGCMGNVVMAMKKVNKLCEHTICRMEDTLRNINYRGPMDINCIVNAEGAYGLEFTARFGYDAIEALMAGLRGRTKITDLLYDVADGVATEMDATFDYMIAVRGVQPPYPLWSEDLSSEYHGAPFSILDDRADEWIYLSDIEKHGDRLIVSGADGCLFKATAYGRTIREAQRRVYKTLSDISTPDLMYRQDIGSRVEKDLKQLKDWGWI